MWADEVNELEIFDTPVRINGDDWRGALDNIARWLCEEAGVTLEGEAFDDFKYDMLEDELFGAVQLSLSEAWKKRACDPDFWKDDIRALAEEN